MVRPAALHRSGGGSAVGGGTDDASTELAEVSIASGDLDVRGIPGFAQTLSAQQPPDRATARAAAAGLVASAFIQPVLSSLRERPFAAPPFQPGPMEKRFGLMLDWQIADRITQSANFPLVDAIADRLMPRTAAPIPGTGQESIDVAA